LADVSIYSLQAGALENIIKQSQLEIIELQHTVDDLRYLYHHSVMLLYLIDKMAVAKDKQN